MTSPILRTFMQHSVTYFAADRPEATFVNHTVPDNAVKYRDPGLSCCREIRLLSSKATFLTVFFRDNFPLQATSEVISSVKSVRVAVKN